MENKKDIGQHKELMEMIYGMVESVVDDDKQELYTCDCFATYHSENSISFNIIPKGTEGDDSKRLLLSLMFVED